MRRTETRMALTPPALALPHKGEGMSAINTNQSFRTAFTSASVGMNEVPSL
jgi:hypothetical protein